MKHCGAIVVYLHGIGLDWVSLGGVGYRLMQGLSFQMWIATGLIWSDHGKWSAFDYSDKYEWGWLKLKKMENFDDGQSTILANMAGTWQMADTYIKIDIQ